VKSDLKIIIVDDHKIFREGIKSLITTEKIASVIAEAKDGQEFINLLDNNFPDVVLMDISMPIMNGLEATKIAIQKYPNLNILVLSSYSDSDYHQKMVEAGVKGFILKDSGMAELQEAIEHISKGECFFLNELLKNIIKLGSKTNTKKREIIEGSLSKREIEIVILICGGMSNEEIAEKLFISKETVKGHRKNIMFKTECNNTASLVMYAIKNEIVHI
jgi:DNA-binding NarL/FixJ family response regulator